MTTDDTLRATLFTIEKLLLDVLARLQTGNVTGLVAISLLRSLETVEKEFRRIREAADHSPELYTKFAAPGGSAN